LIKFKWLLKLVHRLLVHPISKPLIPSITYYPQTRQEPGKHSHPELPALGRAEDLSHCSTDCLQIFIYIHFICVYETCTRTNHKWGKSQRRHVWKVASQKNLSVLNFGDESRWENYSRKLNPRLQFAM